MKGSEALSAATIATPGSARPAPSRTKRFHLAGPTLQLDRRIHAIRKDVADVALAGRLFAPHYASAETRCCALPSTMLRAQPDAFSTAVSQLLSGEGFAVLDESGGWAWGYCLHDHYVGYVDAAALAAPSPEPTHIVVAGHAPLFAAADIKSPVLHYLPMGARVTATSADERFIRCDAGYLHIRHVHTVDCVENDPVAVAERLVGIPYVWGGRAGDGLDCSGLVQLCLAMAGVAAPRDSDQQRDLGTEIASGDPLRRGDLIFFPGHVGMMVDSARMIHANAHWMAVTVEALADVVARLAPDHAEPVIARRRISA